jgi:hypothetical protein
MGSDLKGKACDVHVLCAGALLKVGYLWLL